MTNVAQHGYNLLDVQREVGKCATVAHFASPLGRNMPLSLSDDEYSAVLQAAALIHPLQRERLFEGSS
jgi:hypothetical protein